MELPETRGGGMLATWEADKSLFLFLALLKIHLILGMLSFIL